MNTPSVVETALRVRYAETDAMGIVHHANYLVWFEAGRGDYFRHLGVSYEEVEERGYLLPLSEAYVRYAAPAHYGEMILVRTWIQETRSRSLMIQAFHTFPDDYAVVKSQSLIEIP